MRRNRAFSSRQSALCFGVALSLHAAALLAVIRDSDVIMPAVSVPLSVSFATASEPMQVKRETAAPKPRPVLSPQPTVTKAAVAEPESAPAPAAKQEPAPSQVTPPRFDAAYLNNPVPAYPALSRRLRESGRVWLRVFVNADGSAREVAVETSSGYARLDSAAREAVERWRFTPARNGGSAVGAWVLVPISFTLS